MATKPPPMPGLDSSEVQLPSIAPVHSTPSKKQIMKQKLSRITFPFSSSHDRYNNEGNDGKSFDEGNHTNLTSLHSETSEITDDRDPSDTSYDEKLNSDYDSKYDENGQYQKPPVSNTDGSFSNPLSGSYTSSFSSSASNVLGSGSGSGSGSGLGSIPKLNKSATSLANSIPFSLNKLPYKSINNGSTTSLRNKSLSNQIFGTSSNHSNVPVPSNITITHASPGKLTSRSLATNNDHTFMLGRSPNVLQPQSQPDSKLTHSPSPSMFVNANDHDLNDLSKPLSLPQFNHSQEHEQELLSSPTNKLSVPTVIAPIYKKQNSNTQIPQSSRTPSLTSPSNVSNHSTAAINDNSPNANLKKNTGLLQCAYRTAHNSNILPNADNSTDLQSNHVATANSNTSSNEFNQLISNDSTYDGSTRNNSPDQNSQHHIISPKILNDFKLLESSIKIGIKKRLDYLDSENTKLLLQLKMGYSNLDEIENHLLSEIKDLDNCIENLRSKKTVDLQNLKEHGLFENLNDLITRIDNIKINMDDNKTTLTLFEKRLNIIDQLRTNSEIKYRNRKQMFIAIALFVLLVVVFKILKRFY